MRKLMLMALALVIGTASLFASNVGDSDAPKDEIRDQIVKLLKTPSFSVDQEYNVNISFTFSSEGEIIVLNIDSKDRDVLDYIRENLNYKKIQSPGEKDKLYKMPLKVTSA
jgi:type II secretory pathway component PulL